MSKTLSLADIKNGALINNVKKKTIEFLHDGESNSVNIYIKALPFSVTEKLYQRLPNIHEDKKLMAEWVSLALVNEQQQPAFTQQEILDHFTMPLVVAIFNEVIAMDTIPKDKTDDSGKSDSPQTTS